MKAAGNTKVNRKTISVVFVLLVSFAGILRAGEIHVAAESGDLRQVKALLDAHPDLLNARDESGHAPLYFAAGAGHKDIVEFLLARGADVNAKDKIGETPLFAAVDAAQLEIVRVLLAKGADVGVRDKFGATPTSMARIYKDPAMISVLEKVQATPREDNILRACDEGDVSKVKAFLKQNPSAASMTNGFGRTPLHITLQRMAMGTVVEAMSAKDAQSLESNSKEIVYTLLKNHAPVNAVDRDGRTPLHNAVLSRSKEMVVALLGADASPNAKDAEGSTPLHHAAMVCGVDIVKLLVEKGADVNARNYKVWTPLRCARESRKILVNLSGGDGDRDAVIAFLQESGGKE